MDIYLLYFSILCEKYLQSASNSTIEALPLIADAKVVASLREYENLHNQLFLGLGRNSSSSEQGAKMQRLCGACGAALVPLRSPTGAANYF
jgi:hypothetical protein